MVPVPRSRKPPLRARDALVSIKQSDFLRDAIVSRLDSLLPPSWQPRYEALSAALEAVRVPCFFLPSPFVQALRKEEARRDPLLAFKELMLIARAPCAPGRSCHEVALQRQHPRCAPPSDAAAFLSWARIEDADSWQHEVIVHSKVKGTERRLSRGAPPGEPRCKMSIARTMETRQGESRARVREIEVVLLKENGDADFFVYGPDGKFALTSQFQSGTGAQVHAPVPQVCMSCHHDRQRGKFGSSPLSFGR